MWLGIVDRYLQELTVYRREQAVLVPVATLQATDELISPLLPLRAEFESVVKNHPLWDERVYCLQVTELKERTVELRVLVSAVDSPKAFDLRCDVREAMLKFMQHHYPECLPVFRLDSGKPVPADGQIAPNGAESSRHLMAEEIRDIEV